MVAVEDQKVQHKYPNQDLGLLLILEKFQSAPTRIFISAIFNNRVSQLYVL